MIQIILQFVISLGIFANDTLLRPYCKSFSLEEGTPKEQMFNCVFAGCGCHLRKDFHPPSPSSVTSSVLEGG